jgi:uncharacterized protein
MPSLCDVNVLLALCYDGHVHNPPAIAWLEKQEDLDVVLCRQTQLGLLRLLSNPAAMGPDVCTLGQAWSIYDLIVQDARFEFSAEPEGLEPFLRQYSSSSQVSPKLWQDAYLAAFARAAKIKLVTFDQGFEKFKGLQLARLG